MFSARTRLPVWRADILFTIRSDQSSWYCKNHNLRTHRWDKQRKHFFRAPSMTSLFSSFTVLIFFPTFPVIVTLWTLWKQRYSGADFECNTPTAWQEGIIHWITDFPWTHLYVSDRNRSGAESCQYIFSYQPFVYTVYGTSQSTSQSPPTWRVETVKIEFAIEKTSATV